MDSGTIALFIPIVAIVMGTLLVAIPLIGFTARYAIKPLAEAMAVMRGAKGSDEKLEIMGQRMLLLEQQMSTFESEVHRVTEAQEFQNKLLGAEGETAAD